MKTLLLFVSGFICGVFFLAACAKTDVAQSFAQSVIKAIDVVFDNQGTNLSSTNVQTALIEVNAKIPVSDYIKSSDINKLWGTGTVWYGSIWKDNINVGIPFSISFPISGINAVTLNNVQYFPYINIPDEGIISFVATSPAPLGSLINVKLMQRNGTNYLTGVSLLNDPSTNTTGSVNNNLIHNYFELKQCAPEQTSC